jgi:hypothetical protein
MVDTQDGLIRVYVRLSALRKNLDKMTNYSIEETYVQEYHQILQKAEALGLNVSDFRVSDSLLNRQLRMQSLEGNRYSDEKYVDKAFFLSKLDAILSYFEILTSEKPQQIGFRKPK